MKEITLRWRHNGRDNVSNHQPHDCLLNRLFRHRSKKTSDESSASLAFVRGIHRWPVNSPHKWPVTRKMFPFDDVIMRSRRCSKLHHYQDSPPSEWFVPVEKVINYSIKGLFSKQRLPCTISWTRPQEHQCKVWQWSENICVSIQVGQSDYVP